MKNKLFAASTLAFLSILNSQLSTVFAQGSLTPPGAPAPTMKTLAQIEPRTPISSTPFTITQPGSYYLTTNLNVNSGDGIDINANGVTLDLNGFTISAATSGSPYAAIGLLTDTLSDITILSGHIVGRVTNNAGVYNGNGFSYGIIYFGLVVPSPPNIRISGVSVSGCLYSGIYVGVNNSAVVESCTVQTVGGIGIYAANVSHSAAYQCGGDAIYAINAEGCFGYANGNGDGVRTSTASNCYGSSSGSGYGVYAVTANACYGTSNTGSGLYANLAIGCYGVSSSGTGLGAVVANSCYSSSGDGGISFKYNMP